MTMVINTNSSAREIYNVMVRTKRSLDETIGELSSGIRIQDAADDAAGLSISEKMRAQIYGVDQATENSQDGLSMLQTAEGGLSEIQSIMQRMRDLAVQASNDTLTSLDRNYVQSEFGELRNEINHIAETTQFNGKKLLNGDAAALWSSDKLTTKAIINGGIYGYEGNYDITVNASVGKAEIQKTNIFTLRQDTVTPWYVTVHTGNGIAAPKSQTPPSVNTDGVYTVSAQTFDLTLTEDTTGYHNATAKVTANTGSGSFTVTPDDDLDVNADIVFKVESVDDNTGDVTFSYSGSTMDKSGNITENALSGSMTITSGTAQTLTIGTKNVSFDFSGTFEEGDKIGVNLAAQADKSADDIVFTIKGDLDSGSMGDHNYTITKSTGGGDTLDFNISLIDKDGELEQGTVHLTTGSDFTTNVKDTTLAVFQRGGDMPQSSNSMQTVSNQSVLVSEIQNLPTGSTATVTATVAPTSGVTSYGTYYLLQKKAANGTITDINTDADSQGVNIKNFSGPWGSANVGTSAYGIQQSMADSVWINASGILKVKIGTIGTNSATGSTWEFWGTRTDGQAATASGSLSIPIGDLNTLTSSSELRSGDLRLGRLRLTRDDISAVSDGDEFYIQILANRSGANDLAFNLSGTDSSNNDLFTYVPTVTLNHNSTMITDSGVNVAYMPYVDGGRLDLSRFTSAASDPNHLNWANFNITLKGSRDDGSLSPTDIRNINGATLVDYDFGTNAVDEVDRIDAEAGSTAIKTSKLRDLAQFYEYGDKFLLDDPKTITIIQGDGKTANVTLYADDTIEDVQNKLNAAIAKELGLANYVKSGDENNFVNFVTEENAEDYKNTSESVAGTMVIHSAIAGQAGRLRFSGDEAVLNAFGLNTLQDASETTYTVNISDAHSGSAVLTNAKLTGNRLIGAISPNVDIEFDRMAGITASWDAKERDFDYETKEYNTVLHLADNTTTLQIGANQGEIMRLNIGSMTTDALNLDAATLMTRESANRAITMLDTAIDKVAMQRAKIGAMENRIEHHIASITTAHENLTNAESRIRDTDMAKAAMNFAKLQIMMQAEIGVNAQANQVAQSVLNLFR